MLKIPAPIYDQIRQHGEAAYPNECCGILLGILDDACKTVTQAIPTENSSATPANHYRIAPSDLIQTLREIRSSGLEIAGFYHSHPGHPAQPSTTDLTEAHWLGCSYLITTIVQGRATDTHAFHLAGRNEEDKYFDQEEILILE